MNTKCDGCFGEWKCGEAQENSIRTVVVSRVGERNLCSNAINTFEALGYVVSEINVKYQEVV